MSRRARWCVCLALLLGCEEGLPTEAPTGAGDPVAPGQNQPTADATAMPSTSSDGGELPAPDAWRPPGPGGDGDGGAGTPIGPGPRPVDCEDGDLDGDGFGAGATCTRLDCDEANRGIHPGAPEACNGIDEDCDGAVDEGLNDQICGLGACQRSVANCVDGQLARCEPGPPADETCNGADDDCDGTIDEGAGGERCGVGACQRSAGCDGGEVGACVPGEPMAEACNGIDDDCDGVLDNGFRVRSVGGQYSQLRQHHAPCDGAGQRIGPDCNAAIHRWCRATGCEGAGFGPLEHSGDNLAIACVQPDRLENVPFATLWTHHQPCDGSNQRIGPDCNAAIHRWCNAQGFVSGFGPLESGQDAVLVACVAGHTAEVVNATYPALAARHGGCTAATRYGADCNAAINRFCTARGAVAGYGPVENSGDDAWVVCLRP
jgi:hypothetical protein